MVLVAVLTRSLFRKFSAVQVLEKRIVRNIMTDEIAVKCARKTMKIGTHNGTFHCDEVLACYMLTQLPEYKSADIIRTRDASRLDECDIVVDVGGVYDPSKHRYDHHQRTFQDSMSTLCPGAKWTTKLSSAGLVYLHFGRRVLAELMNKPADSRPVDLLYKKVYENFIEEVDGIDNGVDQYPDKPKYVITTNLSSRVRNFHPPWNKPELNTDENLDKMFLKAVDYVGNEFASRVQYYADVWLPARALVEEAYSKRFDVDPSGEIMTLGSTAFPWKDHLLEIELESSTTGSEALVKYVLFADTNGQWRVQCVPVAQQSFENRLSLPEKWRGLRDNELSAVSGIDGCIFVHASGFIGGNKTYEGALEMARRSLKIE